jgi:signal transduction histidine kinase
MHNLIDGILQYSRIGRLREKKDEVNLNELIKDIIDMIAPPENIDIKLVKKTHYTLRCYKKSKFE